MKRIKLLEDVEFLHLKLLMTIILLCVFGCLMVFSASSYTCVQKEMYNYDSMYMLKKQAAFAFAGLAALFLLQIFPMSKLIDRFAIPIYIAGYIALFLLLTPFAVSSHGATRWIRVMGIQFQVAEVVKICVIVILAHMINRYVKHLSNPKLTIYMWLAGGIPAILLFIISSDLSSTVVVLAIVFGITFITNNTWKLHLGVGGGVLSIIIGYVIYVANHLPSPDELEQVSFRVGRIAAWIDPERYASDQSYQTLNSLYAIGSGGWFGKGIGMSVMKQGHIPEAQNDMIFAIIVEELGIVGGSVLIGLFMYLLYLLLRISAKAKNLMESTLVMGVIIHVGVQSFFNIAVTLNVLPNTGIGLPFISYGGTSILCLMVEMAWVYSIARRST